MRATSRVSPAHRDRLRGGQRMRLAGEIVAAYVRARKALRGDDVGEMVRLLRERAARERSASGASRMDAGEQLVVAWRLGHAVNQTLDPLPADVRCLARSLTLLSMLERRGIPQTLVIAVRPRPFAAHAWIEVAGQAVLPPADAGYERLMEL